MGEAKNRGSAEQRAAEAMHRDRLRAAYEVVADAAALIEAIDYIVQDEVLAMPEEKRHSAIEAAAARRAELLDVAKAFVSGTSLLDDDEGEDDEDEPEPEVPLQPAPRAKPMPSLLPPAVP